MIDFDKILDDLDRGRYRKREVALAKAQAEINTINREYEAYVAGLYDAVRAIKSQYTKEQEDAKRTDL